MAWEKELEESISTIAQLGDYIELTPELEQQLQEIVAIHPMRITQYYMSLIDKYDPNDPIRRMIVPSEEELNLLGSYDTSGERENTMMPGLQHKYAQTALILATNRCATYCRYCFRKRLVGLPTEEILQRFNDAVKYIENHEKINNVLISGGDPFVLSTGVIKEFLEKLSNIPHLDFIRFGTRVPVTFPDVLLKGVNDDPETLAELQNKLVSIGVNPYYVFQCRPVKRVKNNFQVPLYKGYEIVDRAKKKLNGHSKRFKYIMSHQTGKIEIVGVMAGYIYFKYHQARATEDLGKFFKRKINKTAGWLDGLE